MSLLEKLKIGTETEPQIETAFDQVNDGVTSDWEQDPAPGPASAGKNREPNKAPVRKATSKTATTKLAKEVGDDLATMLEMGAVVWGMRDQCCAPVLGEQADAIGHSIAAILARNPRLLEKFANTDIAVYTVQMLALGRALAPVGSAVYNNHISKARKGDHGPAGGIDLNQFPAYQPDPQFTDFER